MLLNNNKIVIMIFFCTIMINNQIISDEYFTGSYDLYNACIKNDLKSVKELIIKGADVNYFSPYDGTTLLMIAASNGNMEIIKYLVEEGVDINAKNYRGANVLMFIANKDMDVFKYLIENGADIYNKTNDGMTLLMAFSDNFEIINYLLEKGQDVNDKRSDGYTVLMFASMNGSLEIVKYLIEKGADINDVEVSGKNALILAEEYNQYEIADYLKSLGLKKAINKNPGKMDFEPDLDSIFPVGISKEDVIKILGLEKNVYDLGMKKWPYRNNSYIAIAENESSFYIALIELNGKTPVLKAKLLSNTKNNFKFEKFDFAPFKIRNNLYAIGIRVIKSMQLNGGIEWFEKLNLYIFDNNKLDEVLSTYMSYYAFRMDSTENEFYMVLDIGVPDAAGFYSLIKKKDGKQISVLKWKNNQYVESPISDFENADMQNEYITK
jgi:ankyrin repeat protein